MEQHVKLNFLYGLTNILNNNIMKNIPNIIFLNLGEDLEDFEDFNELGAVTWCADKIGDGDIEYQRKPIWHDLKKEPNDLPKESERVIVCVEFENGTTDSEIGYYYINNWVCNSVRRRKRVLAWMDVPKFKY